MVEVFNINDLIYKVNAGITADNSSKGKARTYKEALDTVRFEISKNHSSELINVLYSDEAKEKLKNLIQQDGSGNPALLIALRLLPGVPINGISGIYGSFDFGYGSFVALSLIGFMPKLISFTLVGGNIYDPLSAGFIVPIMLLAFFTGVSLLSVNGVWTTVEKTVEFTKNHINKQKGSPE